VQRSAHPRLPASLARGKPRPARLARRRPAVHTAYVASGAHAVSLIDTRGCNARHLAGCARTPAAATVGTFPAGIRIDGRTHTVYVANFGSGKTGTVSVLDARTCNAGSSAGCAKRATLKVPGGNPEGIAINAATGTLYVPTLTTHGSDLISVFNAATCNAATRAGCGQAPAVLKAGPDGGGFSALSIAVSQATDTIYAADVVTGPDGPFRGHSVSVFNGATCNGTDHTGCGQTPATVRTGYGAAAVAVDPAANMIYVTNFADTSVSVIDGKTCKGTDHTGCHHTPAKIAVGNYPNSIAADPAASTAYIANLDNTVSVIPLTHQTG